MPEPLHVPLTAHQQARFAALEKDGQAIRAASDKLQASLNDTVTAIIAGVVDPLTVQGWDIRQVGAEIVCTPPAEAQPE